VRADLLLRNGLLIDGTGAPGRRAEVAIRGEKLVAIGDLGGSVEADEVLDAAGRVVAPGFIDIHSHGDLILAWPSEERLRLVQGRLAQGITTEIVGNCGLGAAPLFGAGRDLLPRLNGWMTPSSFDWSWSGVDSYLTHLERIGLPLNVGALAPHGPLRLGAHRLQPGEASGGARRLMCDELDRALDEGAFGLSAGLIYPPGMYCSTSEISLLAERAARRNAVFTCHIRVSSETLLPAVE
jgi:N-acyl-D-aspartate/D-glutamate deacylase